MDSRWMTAMEAKDEDAKVKAKRTLMAAKHVLDVAIELLEKERAALLRPKKDDYDCPSWSHKQAHVNGEIAALNRTINLLTIKDK